MKKYWGTIIKYFLALNFDEGLSFWQKMFSCINQIVKALIYLKNKGYSHRDIHAKNILADGFGHAFLADFSNVGEYNEEREKNDVVEVLRLTLNIALTKNIDQLHLSHNSDRESAKK